MERLIPYDGLCDEERRNPMPGKRKPSARAIRAHEAVRQMRDYGIPERDYRAWLNQSQSAKRRGIPFRFTLLGWALWWKIELKRKEPTAKRGRGPDDYVMARYGDRGAYELGNVRCIRSRQNLAEVERETRAGAMRLSWERRKAAGYRCHLEGKTGAAHPRSRAVITPEGEFAAATQAAKVHGITRQAAARRAKTGLYGWRYAPPSATMTSLARNINDLSRPD